MNVDELLAGVDQGFLEACTPEERVAFFQLLARTRGLINKKFERYFPDKDILDPKVPGGVIHAREKYPKHLEFFALGAKYKERLFMAGNRIGKTVAGAFEVTCHLTGKYPDWWTGRRFTTPVNVWAAGKDGMTVRDIIQTELFGDWEKMDFALGMVPAECIVHHARKTHGVPGALDTVWVKHASGGISQLAFKAYEAGRTSFEGTAKHIIWCDEEPPQDCYTEMLFRTATLKGITIITFTPLQGMSEVVKGFLQPDKPEALEFKTYVQAGWNHVPHLDPEEKRALLAVTPAYQIEARTEGTPTLGAGAIYGIPKSELEVSDFPIPKHWKRAFGGDAGGGAKPTAAAWGAIDANSQTLYIYNVYKRQSPEIAVHSNAFIERGIWIPGAMDAAALIITAHDAEQIISAYRRAGLDIVLPDKAVESGIQDVWDLMSAGRFKVFASCTPWWDEFRLYHRDEKGRIVKVNDHLMDATRYLVRTAIKRARAFTDIVPDEQRITDIFNPNQSTGSGNESNSNGWMVR